MNNVLFKSFLHAQDVNVSRMHAACAPLVYRAAFPDFQVKAAEKHLRKRIDELKHCIRSQEAKARVVSKEIDKLDCLVDFATLVIHL